jgi:thioredoxin reductase (NADPH)
MSDNRKKYDVIIIGGGPAGLSAGVYAARDRLDCLLIERGIVGGQILNAEQVENYPGFPEGISGEELTKLMHQQAEKYGLKTINAEVTSFEVQGMRKVVKTTSGDFTVRAVIIASGSEREKLGAPGEEQFTGRGVSYCAACDAAFFPEKTVAVIGGGNAALTEALHLTKFASRIIVMHRRDQLRATRVLQERAFAEPKIEFLWDTAVEEIVGGDFVKSIKLRNVKTGGKSALDVDGVFVSVGLKPNTDYLKDIVPLDAVGAIIVNGRMETEIPGVFAAGDTRSSSGLQVVAAAGDGAIAAMSAGRYLAQ